MQQFPHVVIFKEAPIRPQHYRSPVNSSGNFAMLTAIRRASSIGQEDLVPD
jgi:hypothetical protein